MNQLLKEGFIAARSAGSHSLFDVWAFHPEKKTFIGIQIKTKKGKRMFKVKDVKEYFDCTAKTMTLSYE